MSQTDVLHQMDKLGEAPPRRKVESKPVPPPSSKAAEPPPPIPTPVPPRANNAGDWNHFVETVMKKRPLLGALLCHAEFRLGDGKNAILSFAEGSFYERQANEPKNRAEIEGFLKNYFGGLTTLSITSANSDSLKSIERAKQVENAALKKNALEHPIVLKMKEILGAEVVDVNVEL